jgi:hypothetical protein
MNATMADGLSVACINCVTSSQIQSVNGGAVTGTIPVASLPDLGASYIKNTTSQQASTDFNIGRLQTHVDDLKALVCLDHPSAELCRKEARR